MPQSAQKSLLAQLPPQCAASPDEKMRFFVGWWERMHTKPYPLVAISLKFVEWAEDGAAALRFVWEVCHWPEGYTSSWTFVCWMVDGDGMWMKEFPSKQEAMAYFELVPAVVMARSHQPADGSPIQGVKIRRAS